jgi:hypothetical protein
MKNSKPNEAWHDAHLMPQYPTRAQRVQWHAEHKLACGCRPVPASLILDVAALSEKINVRLSN